MAIRYRRKNRRVYIECTTVEEWLQACTMDKPVKAPYAVRKLWPGPDISDFILLNGLMREKRRLNRQTKAWRRRYPPYAKRCTVPKCHRPSGRRPVSERSRRRLRNRKRIVRKPSRLRII